MLMSRSYGNESSKQQEEIMGTIATIKFGLGIALILLGALVAAFFCYMSIFGKKSSLRQKSISETDKSV
jgi:purine-cytosine permease-like protein